MNSCLGCLALGTRKIVSWGIILLRRMVTVRSARTRDKEWCVLWDLAISDKVEAFIALWKRLFIVKLRMSTGPVVRWRMYNISFSWLF